MSANPGDQMSLVKLDEYASKRSATRRQYDSLKSRCESNSDLKQLMSSHVDTFGRYIQTFTSIEKTETVRILRQIRLDLALCLNPVVSPAQLRELQVQLAIHVKKLDDIVSKHRDILTKVKELQAPVSRSLATLRERADGMERRAKVATVAGIGFAIVGTLLATSKSDQELVKRGIIDSGVQFLSSVAGVIRVFSSDLSTLIGTDSGSKLQLLRAKGQAAEAREMMAKYIGLFEPDENYSYEESEYDSSDESGDVLPQGEGAALTKLSGFIQGLTLDGHRTSVYSVVFSHDGVQLASGSYDKTVRIWDAETGALQLTLEAHTGIVYSVAFSHDGRWLASGSLDKTVRIWHAETGVLQRTLGHTARVNSVAFSHDGRVLASGSGDHTVRIWDAETGVLQRTLKGHTSSVDSVAFSLDGRVLASGAGDHTVRIWDSETGVLQRTLKGHTSSVESVAFSHRDGRRLLASGLRDHSVRIWDPETGVLQRTLNGHTSDVRSVAFSHNGRQLASGADDRTVRIWDVEKVVLQQTLEGYTDWVHSVAFSYDGRRLASDLEPKRIRIWDAKMC